MITVDEAAEIVNEAEEIALAEGCHLRRLQSAERRRLLAEALFEDERAANGDAWFRS